LKIALLAMLWTSSKLHAQQWQGFEWVLPNDSGLLATFAMDFQYTPHFHVGGAAAGDLDGDGFADVVLVRGSAAPRLFINNGEGRFTDRTTGSGLAGLDGIVNGVLIADIDGDGDGDLLLGGVSRSDLPGSETPIRVLLNDGAGRFTDHTSTSNIVAPVSQYDVSMSAHSMAIADIDADRRVDLFVTYWHQGDGTATGHLWRNLGGGRFEDISQSSGLGSWYDAEGSLFNFTPTFTDLDGDGWPDLTIAADFGHSRVFLNQRDGSFADATDRSVITDENGMGASVADFDNDGDFDWFVTSIWEDADGSRPYGTSGNRLYLNDGTGTFIDATDAAGVRAGDWGWGSCAADFDNDGWIDLLMVNGYQTHAPRFLDTAARLFMNDGNGSFTERAAEMGIDSTGQGRSVVCFDSDNDGWIDVLVQNSHAMGETAVQPQFYRNQGGPDHHWLTLRLRGRPPNRQAIGARITVTTASGTRVREIRAGGAYLASQPAVAHFGLGADETVETLEVRWPDGRRSTWTSIATDRILTLDHAEIHADSFD
jgi:hypothetical protein